MDRKEQAGCDNAAQRSCTEKYEWLVATSERVLRKRGFSGYGRDLAHDVREKCERINDDNWAKIANQEAYIARIIINEANDFCEDHAHLVELAPVVLSSSSVEAMDAGILVEEVCNKLSDDEKRLIGFIYEGYSGLEMAKHLGVKCAALRKRLERLKEKIRLLLKSNRDVLKPERTTRKYIARPD
jgi:DNA-directed RNA polymerase specialized sigma24 family protein